MNPISPVLQVIITPIYSTPETERTAKLQESFINWFIREQQITAEMN